MKRSELILMIREEAQKGKTAYAISKEFPISKNTAKKYLEQDISMQHGLKGRTKPSKLDEFKEMIDSFMAEGIFNCVVIFERIQAKGYSGGMSILKEYVRQYRPAKRIIATPRFETLPGKQAQMDWGIVQVTDEDDEVHKLVAFIMILSSSRVKYIEFCKRADLYSLERCMINAMEYYGGVPETILTDNMKTVVERRDAGQPVWNKKFEDFATEMGFIPKVCKPYRPQTKGKVERLVHYLKDNFIPGRSFTDLNDLNDQALKWCKKVDSKRHGTTGEIPLRMLSQEPLLPLASREARLKYRWETRKVTKDGFASFDGVRYGVPWELSGREVQVRILNNKVEFFYNEVRIAEHNLEPISGKLVWLSGQYKGLNSLYDAPQSVAYLRKTNSYDVEQRDLSVYDVAVGVNNHD